MSEITAFTENSIFFSFNTVMFCLLAVPPSHSHRMQSQKVFNSTCFISGVKTGFFPSHGKENIYIIRVQEIHYHHLFTKNFIIALLMWLLAS